MSTNKKPAFTNFEADYAAPAAELPPAAELVAMLEAGATKEEIGAEYGCSAHTVAHRISTSGVLQQAKPKAELTISNAFAGVRNAAWLDDALCAQVDPELFFPEKGGSTREAKRICSMCTVAAECLDAAIAQQERFGIWGGVSERPRRALQAQMAPAKRVCALADCDDELPEDAPKFRKYCCVAHASTASTRACEQRNPRRNANITPTEGIAS